MSRNSLKIVAALAVVMFLGFIAGALMFNGGHDGSTELVQSILPEPERSSTTQVVQTTESTDRSGPEAKANRLNFTFERGYGLSVE